MSFSSAHLAGAAALVLALGCSSSDDSDPRFDDDGGSGNAANASNGTASNGTAGAAPGSGGGQGAGGSAGAGGSDPGTGGSGAGGQSTGGSGAGGQSTGGSGAAAGTGSVLDGGGAAETDAGPDSESPGISCELEPTEGEGEGATMAGITAAHNYWRLRVGVPELLWDADLAAEAQTWAEALAAECGFRHDPDLDGAGENIFGRTTTSPASPQEVVEAWASERALYDFGDTITYDNFIDVGHYTQVVWSSTTHVGCGMAVNGACEGSPRQLWVCRYTPPGNFLGQAPYGFVADPCVDLDNDDVFQHEDPDDTDRTVP